MKECTNVLEQQNNSIDDYSNDDLDEGLDFDNTEIVVYLPQCGSDKNLLSAV